MKKLKQITSFIIVGLVTFCLSAMPKDMFAQTSQPADNISKAQDSTILAWLKDLNEESISITADSVKVSDETIQLLTNEAYRRLMYPATYSWQTAVYFIKKNDLKKAFWFMMNLYSVNDKNKELVVKSFLTYDKLFKMDKILTNVFYAYVLTDTEIGTITNAEFTVTAPHIMEKKLNVLKEILFYLDKYRTTESTDK